MPPKTPSDVLAGVSETALPDTPPGNFNMSITEFCTGLSSADRRVELINAFHSVEAAAGRVSDSGAAYAARFEAFVNQPA